MAISPTDPNFLLIYGLDESLATAVRTNSGSRGSAEDLSVVQTAGTDGIATESAGNGGKAIDLFVTRSGYTGAFRSLYSTYSAIGSAHLDRPALPLTAASDDFAFGTRIRWKAGNVGGGALETESIFGLVDAADNLSLWSIELDPNDATTPTLARIYIALGINVLAGETTAAYTATGSPAPYYIAPNEWYRVSVRVYNTGAGTFRVKVYVYRESTSTLYTFTRASDLTVNYSGNENTKTYKVAIGNNSATSNPRPIYGNVDECWLFDAPMSDGDASTLVSSGISIPWVEPNYSQLDHAVLVSMCKEGASFPPPRALPIGGLKARHPENVRARRFRVRYSAHRAGRPWALRKCQMEHDSSGPRRGRDANVGGHVKFEAGFIRQPGVQPPNCLVDGRNVELGGDSVRSRRGFKVRRDVASVDAANSFISYRDLADQLFRLYKANDSLYIELGASAVSIDTGWSGTHLPSYGLLNGRIVILTPGRQKTHRSSFTAVESFGIATPAAPTAALVAGSLTGTYYYLYTEYDPTTGDESAPGVLVTAISPAAQGVTLTLAAVSSDTRFSQRRIYRSTSGGGATTALLLATIATGTSYTDTVGSDGVTAISQVGGSYISGTPPDTFAAVAIHRERAFYYKGTTYSNRVYWTEAGTLMRFYANAYVEAEGPVRCVIAQGQRLIVFTDYTTELLESDWVRNTDGSYNIQRTVLSRTVGCFGHRAAINAHGQVYWIDSRGAWILNGDQPTPIGEKIRGLFPFINTNLKHRIVAAYDHIRRQIWFCVALGGSEFQSDTSRVQTVLPYHMDKGIWAPPYQLEATFADQFDDDLNGLQFGIMDGIGVFKQMETYEGDGIDGSETLTFEGTITTLTSRILTPLVAPTGWTSNSLRGFGVTLIDSVTGAEFYTLISANDTGTITLLEDPGSGFGSPDLFYIGGIRSFVEPAEQDFDTSNDKICRFLSSEFDDISTARIV